MGFREASLTSDCLLHACCNIHGGGWLGFVHQPEIETSFGQKMFAAAYCDSFKPAAKLEFHAWSGYHGSGGSSRADRYAKKGWLGCFLEVASANSAVVQPDHPM